MLTQSRKIKLFVYKKNTASYIFYMFIIENALHSTV